jgi:hypothetical protein
MTTDSRADALTDERIIDLIYECHIPPEYEPAALDFAQRLLLAASPADQSAVSASVEHVVSEDALAVSDAMRIDEDGSVCTDALSMPTDEHFRAIAENACDVQIWASGSWKKAATIDNVVKAIRNAFKCASFSAAPADAPARLTAQAALAAIETFEIVGENNDSREATAEDRFIITEFIAHVFGGYSSEWPAAAPVELFRSDYLRSLLGLPAGSEAPAPADERAALLKQITRMAPDYCWNESPVEIVSDLINERDEARAASVDQTAAVPALAQQVIDTLKSIGIPGLIVGGSHEKLCALLKAAKRALAASSAPADEAKPIAYLSTEPKYWDRCRINSKGTFTVPVFAAPQSPAPAAEAMASPDLYFFGDHEHGFECPDDMEIVSGRKLGEHFTLKAAWYADREFEVTKVPDDTDDDYEVRDLFATPQPAAQADTIQCQAHSGPDCIECGGTGVWPAPAAASAAAREPAAAKVPSLTDEQRRALEYAISLFKEKTICDDGLLAHLRAILQGDSK